MRIKVTVGTFFNAPGNVNDISGFVKDVGSAAVAISIIQALIVWAVIFTNR
uniref:diacylglycerol kinase n=1 Tax=Polynucleobacter sp. TaxID=2029855 RepID=UPI004048737F